MTLLPLKYRSRRVRGMGPLTWQSRLGLLASASGIVYVVVDWFRVSGLIG